MRSRRGFLGTVLALIGLTAVAPVADAGADGAEDYRLWRGPDGTYAFLNPRGEIYDGPPTRVMLDTLEAFPSRVPDDSATSIHQHPYPDDWEDRYKLGRAVGQGRVRVDSAPSAVVAGALYDFMGRLTTQDTPLILSSHHSVYDLMEAFTAWAKERGLDVDNADVLGWADRLGVKA